MHAHVTRRRPFTCCSSRPTATFAPFRKPSSICRAAGGAQQQQQQQQQLSLHVGDTTIQMPFELKDAQELDRALNHLLKTFSEKQEAKRPRRWPMMEVQVAPNSSTSSSNGAQGAVEVFEVFCNPNAHATAFDAKLLLTLRCTGGVKVTTEGRLSSFKADLDAFLAEVQ